MKLAVVSNTIAESTVVPAESTHTSHSVAEPVSVHDTSNEVWVMLEKTMSEGLGQVGCMKTMLSIAPAGSFCTEPSFAQANTSRQVPLVGT